MCKCSHEVENRRRRTIHCRMVCITAQDQRMVEVGTDLWRLLGSNPLLKQGHRAPWEHGKLLNNEIHSQKRRKKVNSLVWWGIYLTCFVEPEMNFIFCFDLKKKYRELSWAGANMNCRFFLFEFEPDAPRSVLFKSFSLHSI